MRFLQVAGSLAVFVGCLLASFRVESLVARIGLCGGCTILEAIGGDLDNLVMNIPVFAYYAAAVMASAHGLELVG